MGEHKIVLIKAELMANSSFMDGVISHGRSEDLPRKLYIEGTREAPLQKGCKRPLCSQDMSSMINLPFLSSNP